MKLIWISHHSKSGNKSDEVRSVSGQLGIMKNLFQKSEKSENIYFVNASRHIKHSPTRFANTNIIKVYDIKSMV